MNFFYENQAIIYLLGFFAIIMATPYLENKYPSIGLTWLLRRVGICLLIYICGSLVATIWDEIPRFPLWVKIIFGLFLFLGVSEYQDSKDRNKIKT